MLANHKAIFLDRDGVLNKAILRNGKPYAPNSIDELATAPDAISALTRLKQAGFLLIGITNQPDVVRGTTTQALVEQINTSLMQTFPLEEILVCYHDNHHACDCRKPSPGLIITAANTYAIDLSKSFMIGDRWKDIAAGKKAGCKTIFLDYQYNEEYLADAPDFVTTSLSLSADWIITQPIYEETR